MGGTAQACLPWVEHLPGGRDPPAGRRQPTRLSSTRSRPREHALHYHGGHTGQRVEESELPSKSRIKTPYPTEARWNSDSGYVVNALMWLDNFFKRTWGDAHKLACSQAADLESVFS